MRKALPEQGTAWTELESSLHAAGSHDVKWREGRAAVYVFNSGADVMQVAHDAYGLFIAENGLGPAAFPSLKRMEQEVVDIALSLQNAPVDAAGSMSSGGTESILLAMMACRDWSLRYRTVLGTPKIVVPYSAHPAFNKGAHLMGLDIVRVPLMDGYRADPQAMAEAIDARTIMLVGSAPCFPYGVIDPIEALSTLAIERGIWLHVDACVGGYLSPFMAQVREERQVSPLPAWDFSLPGVSSMYWICTSMVMRQRVPARCCTVTNHCTRRRSSTLQTGRVVACRHPHLQALGRVVRSPLRGRYCTTWVSRGMWIGHVASIPCGNALWNSADNTASSCMAIPCYRSSLLAMNQPTFSLPEMGFIRLAGSPAVCVNPMAFRSCSRLNTTRSSMFTSRKCSTR